MTQPKLVSFYLACLTLLPATADEAALERSPLAFRSRVNVTPVIRCRPGRRSPGHRAEYDRCGQVVKGHSGLVKYPYKTDPS